MNSSSLINELNPVTVRDQKLAGFRQSIIGKYSDAARESFVLNLVMYLISLIFCCLRVLLPHVKVGYRHIDCAKAYGNEKEVSSFKLKYSLVKDKLLSLQDMLAVLIPTYFEQFKFGIYCIALYLRRLAMHCKKYSNKVLSSGKIYGSLQSSGKLS